MSVSIEEIIEIVALQLGREEVGPGDRLVEDLGAESADMLNLVVTVESRFGVEIEEARVPELRTPEDLRQLVERLQAS